MNTDELKNAAKQIRLNLKELIDERDALKAENEALVKRVEHACHTIGMGLIIISEFNDTDASIVKREHNIIGVTNYLSAEKDRCQEALKQHEAKQ